MHLSWNSVEDDICLRQRVARKSFFAQSQKWGVDAEVGKSQLQTAYKETSHPSASNC